MTAFPNPNVPNADVRYGADTAWGEARDQGTFGMHAVLSVGGNRRADPGWWGRTLTGVFLAGSGNEHQFSCWNEDDPNLAQIRAVTQMNPEWAIAHALAQQLVAGTLADVVDGADSYYRLGTRVPAWAIDRIPVITLGAHVFFRVGVEGMRAWMTDYQMRAYN